LGQNFIRFAVGNIWPIPVLWQRSLIHSDNARLSQTIIHSALNTVLNGKRPDCSINYSARGQVVNSMDLILCDALIGIQQNIKEKNYAQHTVIKTPVLWPNKLFQVLKDYP
jgi:hypothetical protein